ncbi:MAG: beta-ketoacyl-[acyl-carrier-protein] synthase family protein [Enhygromyxa sp.]
MIVAPLAITGLGAVAPGATGVAAFADNLRAGVDAIGPVRSFDASKHRSQIAAEVDDPQVDALVRELDIGRSSALGLIAAREALAAAERTDACELGLIVGTISGDSRRLFDEFAGLEQRPPAVRRRWLAEYALEQVGHTLARELRLRGPRWTVSTACASGNSALGLAARLLRHREVDVALVVGTDALRPLSMVCMDVLRVLDRSTIRPFDRHRRGTVVGEGAGALVLERATPGDARALAWLAGYGESCDSQHMVSPSHDGAGLVRAMRWALAQAGCGPEAIDYINAHGTGTRLNDAIESRAVAAVFGDRALAVPISSTKSMIGHTGAAAGTLEAIATIIALRRGFIPPTIHFEQPDPDCPLDCVPNVSRSTSVGVALSNASGFGGVNASVLLRAPS